MWSCGETGYHTILLSLWSLFESGQLCQIKFTLWSVMVARLRWWSCQGYVQQPFIVHWEEVVKVQFLTRRPINQCRCGTKVVRQPSKLFYVGSSPISCSSLTFSHLTTDNTSTVWSQRNTRRDFKAHTVRQIVLPRQQGNCWNKYRKSAPNYGLMVYQVNISPCHGEAPSSELGETAKIRPLSSRLVRATDS